MNNTDIDTSLLQDLLSDECKCESRHRITVCSYKVTHRNKSCIYDQLGCLNSALHMMHSTEYTERKGAMCMDCGKDLFDCWTIIPV